MLHNKVDDIDWPYGLAGRVMVIVHLRQLRSGELWGFRSALGMGRNAGPWLSA